MDIYRVTGPAGVANINHGDAFALVMIGVLKDDRQENVGNGITINYLTASD